MSWTLNPETGDYIVKDGVPINSGSVAQAAYFRLKVKRTTWLYAPDDAYGSDLYLIKKRPTTGRTSNLESIAERALQPLIDDGRALSADVTINTDITTKRSNAILDIALVDAEQKPLNLSLPQIIGG